MPEPAHAHAHAHSPIHSTQKLQNGKHRNSSTDSGTIKIGPMEGVEMKKEQSVNRVLGGTNLVVYLSLVIAFFAFVLLYYYG